MNFVFDIDGTLSFDGRSISQEITDALVELSRHHNVIFASARPIRDMMPIVPNSVYSTLWIGGNGTFIKEGSHIRSSVIPESSKNIIYKEIQTNNYAYMIDSNFDYAFNGDKQSSLYNNINKDLAINKNKNDLNPICKVVIFSPSKETVSKLEQLDLTIIRHKNEDLIDISPAHCSKDKALKQVDIEEYIAFGNDSNDVGMFKNSIESYCVDESEYSKYATHTIKRDDVAHAISSLINKYD